MKKIALALSLLVTLLTFASACAPRPEEDLPPVGDSLSNAIPDPGAAPAQSEPAKVGTGEPRTNADPSRENYILRSDTAWMDRSGDATIINVRGPLGNGCQKYEYMDSVRQGTVLELTFWASRPKDPNVICTELMQAYTQEIRIENSPYTEFRITQPNGSMKKLEVPEH